METRDFANSIETNARHLGGKQTQCIMENVEFASQRTWKVFGTRGGGRGEAEKLSVGSYVNLFHQLLAIRAFGLKSCLISCKSMLLSIDNFAFRKANVLKRDLDKTDTLLPIRLFESEVMSI